MCNPSDQANGYREIGRTLWFLLLLVYGYEMGVMMWGVGEGVRRLKMRRGVRLR